jgi:pimeloyl-ACP methyl ester carboxylesterase
MKDRKKSKKGKRLLGAAGAIVSTLAVVVPAAVRKLDHTRDGQCRPLDDVNLDFEHHHVKSADGTSIHVTVTGKGEKTAFLIHGWTCRESIFRFQQEALAADYQVISMELRGHGGSSLPRNRDYSTDAMAEDLKAVIDYFDPAEFAVVGFSMGGFTTLKFCQRFGEEYYDRLKGIILLDSTASYVMAGIAGKLANFFYPFPIAIYLRILGYPNRLFDAIRDLIGNTPAAYLLVRYLAYGTEPCGSYVEVQRVMTFSTSVSTIFLALKSIFDYQDQVTDCLPDIPVPVLQLLGSKDKLTCVDSNRCTAELLPRSTMKVFSGAGHNVLLERWEEYNVEITAFLQESFA